MFCDLKQYLGLGIARVKVLEKRLLQIGALGECRSSQVIELFMQTSDFVHFEGSLEQLITRQILFNKIVKDVCCLQKT